MSTNQIRVSTRGWSLDLLLKSHENFCPVRRVSAQSNALLDIIRTHERRGIPLVIEGLHGHEKWPSTMFTLEGFSMFSESQEICVRNVHSRADKTMDLGEFIRMSRHLSHFAEDDECERFYGKDAPCPDAWDKWLRKSGVLPPSVLSHGPHDEFRFRPESSSIETLMCYLGVGDTYTPAHKDLCASSGQNLMCYTENDGSSFWFMTEGPNASEASSYFHELGHELDHEDYIVTLDEFSKAPFKVYVLEQKLGDLVLVPPRSCHQVVNYGGITVKTSWSRMTLQGLLTAYHHELPIYRRVGRPETYRVKSTIHYALVGRTRELARRLRHKNEAQSSFPETLANAINASTCTALVKPSHMDRDALTCLLSEAEELVYLYDAILAEERPKAGHCVVQKRSDSNSFNDDHRIVCDFCDCDVFQSFFECLRCKDGRSGHIICPGCYAEGRSCPNFIMQPMQCRNFNVLDNTRSGAAKILRSYGIRVDNHPTNSATTPKLFHAACVVLEMRKDNKKHPRSCGTVRGKDHEVPFAWGLHCRPCHRSKCFECILNHLKMHSSEALHLCDEDNSRQQYHEKHALSRTRYKDGLDALHRAQREGASIEGHLFLAHITLQYADCMPINLKGMEFGWYDPKSEETVSESSYSSSSASMYEEPKLTIKLPTMNKQPQKAQPPASRKRRQVYVDIPPAPYHKIRRTTKDDPPSLTEVDLLSPHLTPKVSSFPPTRLAILSTSSKVPMLSEDTRRKENRSNSLLTRKAATARPVIKPSAMSPLKYKENQDAKKAILSRLSFKKTGLPTQNEDSAAAISTPLDDLSASSPSVTSPSDRDPQTPPSFGGGQIYQPSDFPPSGDESIIGQLLAQIAGPISPVSEANSEDFHGPSYGTEDSQPPPNILSPNLPDEEISMQLDNLYPYQYHHQEAANCHPSSDTPTKF